MRLNQAGRLIGLLPMLLLLQGCSVLIDIVLANELPAPITVTYTLRPRYPGDESCRCAGGFRYDPPATIGLDSLGHSPWHFLASRDFQFDSISGRFDLVLPPMTALLLTREGYTISLADTGYASRINIAAVSVTGPSGAASWSGMPLFHALHNEGRGIYTLRYP